MMLFWFYMIVPVFSSSNISPFLDNIRFTILMVMTILVTAGGYVINDLQDLNTDLVNKPRKRVIGTLISPRSAQLMYLTINAIALLLATYLVYKAQSFNVLALCASCILVLWAYSRYFKSSLLMGNVIVSLLIAIVPFIFVIVEANSFAELYAKDQALYQSTYSTIISFTIFAFLSNLIREIVKDCEDMEGDQRTGVTTLATALGYRKSDIANQVLTLILLIAAILWLFLKNITGSIIELSIFVFIVIFPIIFLFLNLRKHDRNKAKYTSLSRHLKLMMILGLIYLFIHLNMLYA